MSEMQPPAPQSAQERNTGFTGTSARVDRLAYAALITGAVALVLNFVVIGPIAFLLGPGAAIMGFVSRRRIANRHGALGGSGIALAGLILGIVGFIVNAVWLFLVIVVFGPGLSERSLA